ncbi:serine hydrolase domain-containing protein [Chondrinema litorale]|uniref:serine hydrolase domain-containing protein n=1 Tax=Chondrinema litorale TaxID=2994555 RepID=UPI002542D24E|nr:serine hydrolase domain-containing protein [Chondrinema litorale]UZR96341.1 serine hydrolase [Chondrinema litorale]
MRSKTVIKLPCPFVNNLMFIRKYIIFFTIGLSSYCYGQVENSARLDSLLQSAVNSNIGPGLTVGIVKNGELIYHNSFGNVNLEYDIPFNDSTIFDLASVTKQFTSACIGILENKRMLSVNDDVRKYIPELTFYQDTIRIKHLLNHTSGIRNHNVLLDLMGFDFAHQGYTNEMIEELMFRQNGVNNLPGEKMLYSNTNYVLLALIVKRVSGMKIHEFAQKELFEPLKMTNSFYRNDMNAIIKNRTYSYYKTKDGFKQSNSLSLCVGAGGMKSTISDLAKWSQVFLDSAHQYFYLSKFITHTDKLINGLDMKHARGMFVSPYKGYYTYNHSGRDIGMRSQFICLPELNLAVIVYSNSNSINAVDISYQILDLFIDKIPEANEKTETYAHRKDELKKYVGTYQELNSDMKMQVFVENDTLKAKSSLGNQAVPLKSSSTTSFQRFDNPSVKHIFLSDKDSKVSMQVDFGGAIFYFETIKLDPNPNKNLKDYVGDYFSKELNVTYLLSIKDTFLSLDYPNNQEIALIEGQKDVFGSNRRTKYSFCRNDKGEIVSFKVASEGTVNNILFEKIK